MNPKTMIVSGVAAAALGLAGSAHADIKNVWLTADDQTGGHEMNVGPELRPVDTAGDQAPLLITARTMIDKESPFAFLAEGSRGSVYVNDEGLGVQTLDGSGSKGISGSGGHQNEELIMTFDGLAVAGSVEIGFADYKPGDGLDDKDDTLVFVTLTGGDTLMLTEDDYMAAFEWANGPSEQGFLRFGNLEPQLLDPDALIESITVRETEDHMVVNAIGFSMAPAPGALALMVLAGLTGRSSRRRRI